MGAEELRYRRERGKAEFLSLSHFKAEQELVILDSEGWYCLNRGASEKITYCPVPGLLAVGDGPGLFGLRGRKSSVFGTVLLLLSKNPTFSITNLPLI